MKELNKPNGYNLTKNWFSWCLENRETNTPTLTALYLYIVERCNSLSWSEKFGLPTEHTMYVLAIGSYNTYKKHLLKLEEIKAINIYEKSKNQFSSNIIGLSNFDKALDEPLDKALDEPLDSLVTEQVTSKLSHNKTNKEETIKPKTTKPKTKQIAYPSFEEFKIYGLEKAEKVNIDLDLKKLELKFLAWSENDWKNGYDKKIKNWKTTLLGSLKYLEVDFSKEKEVPKNSGESDFARNNRMLANILAKKGIVPKA